MDVLFFNAFDTAINQNLSLSPIEKFQYLISWLQSEILQVISGLPMSNENYSIAWNLPRKRFHNERKLVSLYVNKIIDMPALVIGSLQSIRSFPSTDFEITQALAALKQEITKENVLLLTILVQRF